jgi:hypothetical protein
MSGKTEIIGSAETIVGKIVRSHGSGLTTNIMQKEKACG